MSTDPGESTEHRRARRIAAAHRIEVMFPVDVLVGLLEADFLAKPLKVEGVTINLSLSGMLARLNYVVPPGSSCVIRFLASREQIAPEILRGTVRRAAATETGCEIAVEFETALEVLKAAGETDDDSAAQ